MSSTILKIQMVNFYVSCLTFRNLRAMPPLQVREAGSREVDIITLSTQVGQESTTGTGYAAVEIDLT
jgi:hypothetical protein